MMGNPSLIDEMTELSEYSQLPPRLLALYPEMSPSVKEDVFGVAERLAALQHVLRGRKIGSIMDLGGNAGTFSLTLVDSGMASRSRVYDLNARALAFGQRIARELGLQDKVTFVEQAVNLSFLQTMESTDTVLCLNLIHHAGAHFDLEEVATAGWESYAEKWLVQLRSKCRLLILGVGLKGKKPRQWDISREERPRRLFDLAKQTGWSVLYDANVEDIHLLGAARANGRRTKRSIFQNLAGSLFRAGATKSHESAGKSKRSKYHLYILE